MEIISYFSESWRSKKLPLFTYVVGQRGTPKILYEGYTYICTKSIKNRKYWVCSKQRSRGCRARIITDYDETELITRNSHHTHSFENPNHLHFA